jgi:hypothetical protein
VSDARTGQRFSMQLPTRIHLPGSADEYVGVTDNLSAAGVYITAAAQFNVGSTLELDVMLPQDIIGSDQAVRLRCTGRVVRTEQSGGGIGVACVIDTYEFVRDT